MTKPVYTCKCGVRFNQRRYLLEHIGLCNPKWPRSSPDDLHGEIRPKFYCSCGMRYSSRMNMEHHLINPVIPEDEHTEITGAEWEAKFINHGE